MREESMDIWKFGDQVLSLYPAKTEEETYFAQSDIFRDGSFAWGTYALG